MKGIIGQRPTAHVVGSAKSTCHEELSFGHAGGQAIKRFLTNAPFNRGPCRQSFQCPAYIEGGKHVIDTEVAYDESTVGFATDQPFRLKDTKRDAYRRPRAPEGLGEIALGNPGARRQLAGDDHFAQLQR